MDTRTRSRTDLGTRRKMRSFERFLTKRFGPSEAAVMRREMLQEYRA